MQSLARFSRFVKQFSAKGGYPVDIENPVFRQVNPERIRAILFRPNDEGENFIPLPEVSFKKCNMAVIADCFTPFASHVKIHGFDFA